MPVEIIIDHWNPSQKRYRFETFCYPGRLLVMLNTPASLLLLNHGSERG
jgi:hypothetical protein